MICNALASKCGASLKRLGLNRCLRISEDGVEFEDAVGHLTGLEVLHLHDNPEAVTDGTLLKIGKLSTLQF